MARLLILIAPFLIIAGLLSRGSNQFFSLYSKSDQPFVSPSKPPSQVLGVKTLPHQELFIVTRVIDGDTIELEGGIKLRYIGIDAPEFRDKEECFAQSASAKNKELVEGKEVKLEKDVSETDKYGRLLRYVYFGNIQVNELLVREGYAKSRSYPPDVKYQEKFRLVEKQARQEGRGLWKECSENVPAAQSSHCQIKGNINKAGGKIYHVPGGKFYEKTQIDESRGERYFCSEEEAREAGWRRSKL